MEQAEVREIREANSLIVRINRFLKFVWTTLKRGVYHMIKIKRRVPHTFYKSHRRIARKDESMQSMIRLTKN